MISDEEARHQVTESIKFLYCSLKTKRIIEIIHETFNVSTNDAEELFSQIMEIMGEDSKFKLIDCMEIYK